MQENLTEKYFNSYKRLFFNHIPPHILYYIHSGSEFSSDVSYEDLINYINLNFLGESKLDLKTLEPSALEVEFIKLHEQLIPDCRGYRKVTINVPLANSPSTPEEAKQVLMRKWHDRAEDLQIFLNFQEKTINASKCVQIRLACEKSDELNIELAKHIIENEKLLEQYAITSLITPRQLAEQFKDQSEMRASIIRSLDLNMVDPAFISKCNLFLSQQVQFCEEYRRVCSHEVSTKPILELEENEQRIVLEALSQFAFYGTLPDKIEAEMKKFCYDLSQKLKEGDPVKTAAWVCLEYTRIHPMENGSGRVSRFIANIILMQSGIMPCIFTNDDEYTNKIRQSNNDHNVFTDYYYEQIIKIANIYKNPTEYYKKFQSFTTKAHDNIKSLVATRNLLATLGLQTTFGKERQDYKAEHVFGDQIPTNFFKYKKKALILCKQAHANSQNQDYASAVKLYQHAIKKYLRAPMCYSLELGIAYYNLSSVLKKMNNIDEALIYSAKAVSLVDVSTREGASIHSYHDALCDTTKAQEIVNDSAAVKI